MHTPGHSKDSMCLLLEDHLIFTGDTLFVGNCGRTDLPGSDAKEMYYSLFDRLAKLDEKLDPVSRSQLWFDLYIHNRT